MKLNEKLDVFVPSEAAIADGAEARGEHDVRHIGRAGFIDRKRVAQVVVPGMTKATGPAW